MKRKLYRVIAMLIVFGMLISDYSAGGGVPSAIEVKAATKKITKKELKKKYIKWLDKNGYEYDNNDSDYTRAKIQYVDIDGNGIIEMIYSSYVFGHVVLTYDQKKGKIKTLKEMDTGKGGFAYYNKKKKMISLSNSSTGNVDTYFYIMTNSKLVQKKVIVRAEKSA